MGCDIHLYGEKRDGTKWTHVELPTKPMHQGSTYMEPPLSYRSYGMFAFLAGVRNYSDIEPISEPRGFPADASPEVTKEYEDWRGDAHTPSWLHVDELTSYDYTQEIEDRRCTRDGNGGSTCEPGEGEKQPLGKFLGRGFQEDVAAIKGAGADRIVFWFDN